MITFDGDNSYYIPNQSRNSLSKFEINKLSKKSFKIQTKVKIDWDNLDLSQTRNGIVVLNGMDMGILCTVTQDNIKMIIGQTWTQGKEEAKPEEIMIPVNDDILDIEFDYEHMNKISLKVNDKKEILELNTKNVIDYTTSVLWIGCCNNSIYGFEYVVPEFLKGNLNGEMHSLKIYSEDKVVVEYDFEEQTEFKVRDISGNGNHLIRKVIDKDLGHLVLF